MKLKNFIQVKSGLVDIWIDPTEIAGVIIRKHPKSREVEISLKSGKTVFADENMFVSELERLEQLEK